MGIAITAWALTRARKLKPRFSSRSTLGRSTSAATKRAPWRSHPYEINTIYLRNPMAAKSTRSSGGEAQTSRRAACTQGPTSPVLCKNRRSAAAIPASTSLRHSCPHSLIRRVPRTEASNTTAMTDSPTMQSHAMQCRLFQSSHKTSQCH